jgi:hypothetical protein
MNLVWAIMRIPFKVWPGHHLSLPIGLELSLSKKRGPTNARCPIAHAAPWPAASSTTSQRNSPHVPCASPSTVAMPLRPSDVPCLPTSMWLGASYARPNAITRRPHVSKASAERRANAVT